MAAADVAPAAAVFALPASVTVEDATAARAALTAAVRLGSGSEMVVVDASGLQRFDSAALAVLLEGERLAGGAGKRFRVQGLPASLASLAMLYGVDGLLAP